MAGAAVRRSKSIWFPRSREITVRDLLTHGSGLMSGGLGQRASASLAQRAPDDTLATYIPKLGGAALDFQPGTLWRYSGLAGFDVLSRIVEITSGQTFDRFLKQRLFDPLGMKDTGFALLPDRASRIVPLYRRAQNGSREAARSERLEQRDVFLGRRRSGEHRRGLRAVCDDAREWRGVERQALSQSAGRSS